MTSTNTPDPSAAATGLMAVLAEHTDRFAARKLGQRSAAEAAHEVLKAEFPEWPAERLREIVNRIAARAADAAEAEEFPPATED
ncbi:MAG: hypothetical protein ABIQ18_11830 [Umezawaea sp.]